MQSDSANDTNRTEEFTRPNTYSFVPLFVTVQCTPAACRLSVACSLSRAPNLCQVLRFSARCSDYLPCVTSRHPLLAPLNVSSRAAHLIQ